MMPQRRFTHRTAGVSGKRSRCRIAQGPIGIGWDDLPWMQFPARPRRQFLRFVATARELGCVEDRQSFDRVLAGVGAQSVRLARGSRATESKPCFAESAREVLVAAAA